MSMETANLKVEGMSCSHCVGAVKSALDALPGVSLVSVSLDDGTVTVDYDTTGTGLDEIKDAITEAGYEVL
ncbi:MAG: Copper chaperone CopZ [Firmicutes bacterium ADurb.Bin193]|nr:MAG: Copper chaperone CopZ [Firmicutes bacterium ADurb.Bin193]